MILPPPLMWGRALYTYILRVKKIDLWEETHRVRAFLPIVIFKHIVYRLQGKNILTSNRVVIKGVKNIFTCGILRIGLDYIGFMDNKDRVYLNVSGILNILGDLSIGKGCRFDISGDAAFGNSYIGPNTCFVIMNGITVGDGCVISWGCQFLDDDFHRLRYEKKTNNKSNKIYIGNKVWIGSNVSILKGSVIPDGCVVASGSVVSTEFTTKNALIAGIPAKIIKNNIIWE